MGGVPQQGAVPASTGDWDQFPYERVETLLPFPALMPGFNLSVFSFYSEEWAVIFLLPSSPPLWWVSLCGFHLLSTWDRFLSASSSPASNGSRPNATPGSTTSAAGLVLHKTYAAAGKSPELFLPPFSQSCKFITSKTYPEWKRGQAARRSL